MHSPQKFYSEVAATQSRIARRATARYDRLAIVRLVIFFAFVGLLIFSWTTDWRLGLAVTVILTPLLAYGVRKHRHLKELGDAARVQSELAEAELAALDHRFDRWDDGKRFSDPLHPYAVDLDIFGPHSLYQFINRTVTAIGSERLADHLLHHADHEIAEERRAAGIALVKSPEWLLNFRTLGHGIQDDIGDVRRLHEWLERPAVVTGAFALNMLWAAPLLTVVGLWWCFTQSPWQLGLLAFVPAVLLMRRYSEIIAREHAYTGKMGEVLKRYGRLPSPPVLPSPPGRGAGGEGKAGALETLSYAISQLDVRYNPFVALLEFSGLWSLQWLRRLDKWREAHRQNLPRWLDELAQTDALVSWATLRYNHPEWTEPELTDQRVLTADGLGHPLLPPNGRITNDIDISTDGHIHLVTGSNMAGKSTWLRTVGVNLVLARAGGPVCALHLRTAALNVWTSMRTQDDLSESTSSFYAELKRLKSIIEAVSDPNQEVFFLLDEILKGTNSRDRHTGARALIRQLIRERGAGIIATHDLELADLENEVESKVENYAMEVQTRGGQLTFDYKLHRGVSKSFNATALMARMGIDIDPEDIKLTHN